MIGMKRSYWAGLFASLGLLFAESIHAQEAVLAELFGQGVHAYFANDFAAAHEMFSGAIEQGSRDPRSYYFRGLAYARLGRPDESNRDFKTGAELEVASSDRVYPIADSLQRVQGAMRLKIEKQRQSARLASASKSVKVQAARYEDLKRSEGNVLRNSEAKPAAAPAEDAAKPAGEDKTDPFAGDAAAAKPEAAPEKPAEPAAPAAPAAADPFGNAPATPAPTPEAPAAPPADAANNPFGDDKPAAPPAADPAAPKPPADADPFGG